MLIVLFYHLSWFYYVRILWPIILVSWFLLGFVIWDCEHIFSRTLENLQCREVQGWHIQCLRDGYHPSRRTLLISQPGSSEVITGSIDSNQCRRKTRAMILLSLSPPKVQFCSHLIPVVVVVMVGISRIPFYQEWSSWRASWLQICRKRNITFNIPFHTGESPV